MKSGVQNVDAIAKPESKEISFSINQQDGSIATRSLKGISVAKLKTGSKLVCV